eukprot:8582478-Pyramimonas_sp.AAC.1
MLACLPVHYVRLGSGGGLEGVYVRTWRGGDPDGGAAKGAGELHQLRSVMVEPNVQAVAASNVRAGHHPHLENENRNIDAVGRLRSRRRRVRRHREALRNRLYRTYCVTGLTRGAAERYYCVT